MKLQKVQDAEDLRHTLIAEVRASLERIFARWGDHVDLHTPDLAIKLVDEIDWDAILEKLK